MSFFMNFHKIIPLKETYSETLYSIRKRVFDYFQQDSEKKFLTYSEEITITGEDINLIFHPEKSGFEINCPSAEKKFSENSIYVSLQKNIGSPCFLIMGKNVEISRLIINGSKLRIDGKRKKSFDNLELAADRIHIPGDFSADRIAIKGETVSVPGKIYSKNAVFFGENFYISGELYADSVHINASRISFTATVFQSENFEINASFFSGTLKYGDSWIGKRHLSISGVKEKVIVALPEDAGTIEINAENTIKKERY